jgi:hypothetical protein
MPATAGIEIGHLDDMCAPDHSAVAGKRIAVRAVNPNDSAQTIFPDNFAARRKTKGAIHHARRITPNAGA